MQVTGSETESWSNTIDAEEVLKAMNNTPDGVPPWSPIFQRLVKCTPPETIINFELWWRDPQLQWASPFSRVVQIGDSAHSFLPSSGNGATQAFEDAVSLASCLQVGGKMNVEQAVQVHKALRYKLCSFSYISYRLIITQIHPHRLCPKNRLRQRRAVTEDRLGPSQDRSTKIFPSPAKVDLGS
jgi:hypothetical protein